MEKTDDEFVQTYYKSSKEMTLDDVRKKAFGTLEDDIDLNLNTDENLVSLDTPETVGTTISDDSLETDIFEEMDDTKNEPLDLDLKEDHEEITFGNVAPEMEKKEVHDVDSNEEVHEEEPLDDSDLFNLIDSMYEKRDER